MIVITKAGIPAFTVPAVVSTGIPVVEIISCMFDGPGRWVSGLQGGYVECHSVAWVKEKSQHYFIKITMG
jgi:hypothetical protein